MVVLGGATSGLFAPVLVHLPAVSCKKDTIHDSPFSRPAIIHKQQQPLRTQYLFALFRPPRANQRAQNLSAPDNSSSSLSRGKECSSRVKAAHQRKIFKQFQLKAFTIRRARSVFRPFFSVATHFILKCTGTHLYMEKSVISKSSKFVTEP